MHRISDLEQAIRAHVNDHGLYERHFYRHNDDWHALCVAMDTLGDTALALLDYEEQGFGTSDGERYLRLHGFLQTVVLQQDSISKLGQLMASKETRSAGENSWAEIREVRNLSTGHPLENTSSRRGTIKRVFVSRPTISSAGFTLLTWDKRGATTEFRHVNLSSMYSGYKENAIDRLKKVASEERRRWPASRTVEKPS